MSAAVGEAVLAPFVPSQRTAPAGGAPGFERALHDELGAPPTTSVREPGPHAVRNGHDGALHRASARPAADEQAPGRDVTRHRERAGEASGATVPQATAGPVGAVTDASVVAGAAVAGLAAAIVAADTPAGRGGLAVGPVTGPVPAVAPAAAAGEIALAAQLATGMADDPGPGAVAPTAAPSTGAVSTPADGAAAVVAAGPAAAPTATDPTPLAAVATQRPAADRDPAVASATGSPSPATSASGAGDHRAAPAASVPGASTDSSSQPAAVPADRAGQAATGLPAGLVAPARDGVAAPSAPAQPAPASSSPPATIADQLGARLRALGGLAAGHHVLSVPLDPEHLGPVRVVAHISADAVRVDLVGTTDASRDALRGALADLRRDLTAAGLNVEVGLGGGAAQQGRPGSGDGAPSFAGHLPDGPAGAATRSDDSATPTRAAARGLDVLA